MSELLKYLYGIQVTGTNQMPVLNITGHILTLLYCLIQIKKKLMQGSRKIELQI